MNQVLSYVRVFVRSSVRRPMFAILSIVALGLANALTISVVSAVNALWLRPLAGVRAPTHLARVGIVAANAASVQDLTHGEYKRLLESTTVFEGIAAHRSFPLSVRLPDEEQARRRSISLTSGNYFDLLGVIPVLGRVYTDVENNSIQPVALISYAMWNAQFGGSRSALGQALFVSGVPYEIIGVLPESFEGTEPTFLVDVYIPASTISLMTRRASADGHAMSLIGSYRILARLRADVPVKIARASLTAAWERINNELPAHQRNRRPVLYSERESRPDIAFAPVMPRIFGAFIALGALVCLLACASVLSLMIARASVRTREVATRRALGATAGQISAQWLTESVVISLLGMSLGLALSFPISEWIEGLRFGIEQSIRFEVSPDLRVAAIAGIVALVAAVLVGAIPAARVRRVSLGEVLGLRSPSGVVGDARLRAILIAAQLSISTTLLAAAGLLQSAAWSAADIELGVSTTNVLSATSEVATQGFSEQEGRRFYLTLLERVRQLPDVQSATLAQAAPLGTNNVATSVAAADRPMDSHTVFYNVVEAQYFSTLELPLLRGRDFRNEGDGGAESAVVVNEALANLLWPNGDAIGRRIRLAAAEPLELEVLGIVRNSKYVFPNEATRPYFYRSGAKVYRPEMRLLVRTRGAPASTWPSIREAYRSVNVNVATYEVGALASNVDSHPLTMLLRAGATMATSIGILGLLLASVTLYGVVAQDIGARTREIGIRLALGARSSSVVLNLLSRTALLAGLGWAIGSLIAIPVLRQLSTVLGSLILPNVVVLTAAGTLLVVVALLATYIAGRRGAAIQPARALREE